MVHPGLRPLLLLAFVASGCFLRHKPSLVPPMSVDMEKRQLDEFYDEIQDYVRLRRKVVDRVTPLPPEATAEAIAIHQKAMTDAIVAYRKKARQGEIFEPDIETAFRRIIRRELEGREGAAMLQELRSGNPKVEGVPKASNPTQEVKKAVTLRINGYYADGAPFSSVPPTLLQKLPELPEQVRYRFVGRALILRDTEANIILDYISDVIPDPSIPR
jgi:hypothetical protein